VVRAAEIRKKALSLGFGAAGFTDPAPFTRWGREIARRMRTEEAMRPVWERYQINPDPRAVMPNVKTVVVLVWPYEPYTGEWPKGYLRWSAFYQCRHAAREAVGALTEWLWAQGIAAMEASSRIPLKEAARRAGLGSIGRNQLLITPKWGSCVALDAVLIDAEITDEDERCESSSCGACGRCVAACPTGALGSDGTFSREKCLRHYMLSGDCIPESVRGQLRNNLVGCDICQAVCPQNHGHYKEERVPGPDMLTAFAIGDILREWETGLKNRMGRMAPVIGANYARAQKILAAALIAAREEKGLTQAIGRALAHPHPHIRRYAAWALSFHEGEEAERLLREALTEERDRDVIEEITAALDRRAHAGKDKG